MGWAIYRGFELIRKGDDDTRLVIDYSADVPVERPYTEEENTIADAQALAIDAYEEHMRKRKEAFENAIQVPILFEDVEDRITETNTILEENQQKVEANIQAITQLRDTTLPALEATLTQARDEAAAAKATADSAVVSSINEYTRTDTIEEVPTDDNTWSTETPEYLVGYHYWMRTILTRGDGSTTKTSPVLVSSPGTTGEHGIGIQSMDVYYYRSLSSEELVGGAWTTTAPAWISGQFVWEKIVTTFTDGMTSESDPINITGAFGSDGDDGVGIVDIQEQYYLSTSSSQLTGGSWSNDVPAWVDGRFYWTLSVITYTDNTTHTTTPKMVSGGKGADGSPGLSVVSITPLYRQLPVGSTKPQKPSGTGTPSGWSTTEPDYAPSTELYRTEQVLYSNDTASYTDVTLVSSYTAVVTLKTALDNNEVAVANLRDNTIPALNSQLNQSIDTLAALQSKQLTVSTNYPPSTTEDYPSNAQWIRVDSNNRRIGFWIIQGNNWVPSTLSPIVIPALDAGIITSGTISTARLNTTELAAAIATIIELNADRITTGTIDTGRLRAEEVAAAIATFLELDVGNLVAGTADIDEAVVQKLFADMFATRQLSANQILVHPGNEFPDPYFEDTAGWTGLGVTLIQDASVPGNVLQITGTTTVRGSYYHDSTDAGKTMALQPGDKYRVTLRRKSSVLARDIEMRLISSGGTTQTTIPRNSVANTWEEVSFEITAPTGVGKVLPSFHTRSTLGSGVIQIADVRVTSLVDGTLIVTGSIMSPHLNITDTAWMSDAVIGDLVGRTAFLDYLNALDILARRVLVYNAEGELVTKLDGEGDQAVAVADSTGEITAYMAPTGQVAARTLNVADSITYRGTELAELVDRGRVVAFYREHAPTGGVTTVLGTMLRICSVTFLAQPSQLYRIMFGGLNWWGTQAGARCAIKIHVDVGGVDSSGNPTTPSSGSLATHAAWQSWNSEPTADTSTPHTSPPLVSDGVLNTYAQPRLVRVTAGIQRTASTGYICYSTHPGWFVRQNRVLLTVEDMGARADVEADGIGHWEGTEGTTPPTTPVTRTLMWYGTGHASYLGSGTRNNGTQGSTYAMQGRTPYNTSLGAQKSVITFPDSQIRSALAGATINKVRIRLTTPHWHWGSGGTARIARHNHSSVPASNPSLTHLTDVAMGRGDTKWIDLPVDFGNRLRDGTARGFGLDPLGSTSDTYYGYAIADPGASSSVRPAIEITFTRNE